MTYRLPFDRRAVLFGGPSFASDDVKRAGGLVGSAIIAGDQSGALEQAHFSPYDFLAVKIKPSGMPITASMVNRPWMAWMCHPAFG